MSTTIRFPLLKGVEGAGIAETSEVITLLNGVNQLLVGGLAAYSSIAAWRFLFNNTESPYPCAVIEFLADAAGTIGDGTNPICLFGEINLANGTTKRQLLGMLGINFAATNVPQIPMIAQAAANIVGYSQVVSNVANYNALSVGTLTGDLSLPEGVLLTVQARPIHQRSFGG